MKIYFFESEGRGYVLAENGLLLADDPVESADVFHLELTQQNKHGALLREKFPRGYHPVWCDSPEDHPGIQRALVAWRTQEEAALEPEGEPDLTPEAMSLLKADHKCSTCVLAPMCGVATAIDLAEQRGGAIVVQACLQYVEHQEVDENS